MSPEKNLHVSLPQILVASAETSEVAEVRLAGITGRVQPTETFNFIHTDESDNRILECAAAKSDYIITGDAKHILPLGSFAGIPIVTVAEFLWHLREHHGDPG